MDREPMIVNMFDYGNKCPAGAVRVDRCTPYGNPFKVGRDGTRKQCVAKYEPYARQKIAGGEWDVSLLWGKDLACWCAPKPCHADVLLRLVTEVALREMMQEG